MAPPRRDARFTARDVMEMVVNGGSDVDIDITETDEESGEEEDYGMELNENQPPSETTDGLPDIQLPQPAIF